MPLPLLLQSFLLPLHTSFPILFPSFHTFPPLYSSSSVLFLPCHLPPSSPSSIYHSNFPSAVMKKLGLLSWTLCCVFLCMCVYATMGIAFQAGSFAMTPLYSASGRSVCVSALFWDDLSYNTLNTLLSLTPSLFQSICVIMCVQASPLLIAIWQALLYSSLIIGYTI